MTPTHIGRVRPGDPIRASTFNRLTRAIKDGIRPDSRWFSYRSGTTGRPLLTLNIAAVKDFVFAWILSKIAFGYKINQNDGTVLIRAGRCATRNASQAISNTTVSIGAGATSAAPHYVYVRFEIDDITTAEIPGTALASYPVTTQLYYNRPLYAFSRENNIIKIEKIHHLGDVVAELWR